MWTSILKKLVIHALIISSSTCFTAPYPQDPPSAEVVQKLELYSQYSAAVYCPNNTLASPGALLNCSTANCPEVANNGAVFLGGFLNILPFYSTCLMAVDPTEKNLVLSCRGAQVTGISTALLTILKPCPAICAKCSCYAGLYNSWLSIRDRVTSLVYSAQHSHPGYPLVVTGRSLGAAQAFYAAAELRTNGTPSTLYTYGQPHTGDINLAQYVTNQGSNYRVTHTDDPTPRTGPPLLGYQHISPEYWIFKDEPGFHVRPQDVAMIPGFNNETGNQGTGGFDADAHYQYFQLNITSCYSPTLADSLPH